MMMTKMMMFGVSCVNNVWWEDELMMMTKMMMFGVSYVNNVWWEVEEGAPGNSNERLPQVQAQPHFSDTNPFHRQTSYFRIFNVHLVFLL